MGEHNEHPAERALRDAGVFLDSGMPEEAWAAMRNAKEDFEALAKERRDLLAALEEARTWIAAIDNERAWYGTMGNDGQGHDEGEILAAEMLARVRAAIAKARGQEVE